MEKKNISIVGKERCFGCHGCSQICPAKCISLRRDDEGFLFPHVGEGCVHCGLCVSICPAEHRELKKTSKVFAAKNVDQVLQYSSSSGGVFSSLAQPFLNGEGAVYGAVYNSDFDGVCHVGIGSEKEIGLLRGSKYVQSNLDGVYRKVEQDLKSQKKVLFSGTPCQVMGLKNFLRREYSNLLSIDLLCYGVPSPKLFRYYTSYLKSLYGPIGSINMKDKKRGWNKQIPKIRMVDGTVLPTRYGVLWLKIYFSRLALRPTCYTCPFTCETRCGDLTIGDYWGIENINPGFYSPDGVSLILVNSPKGEELLRQIEPQLELYESNSSDCLQQALEGPMAAPDGRAQFWARYRAEGFVKLCEEYWQIQ